MDDPRDPRHALADFAAGCFWGVEAEFRAIRGVVDVVSGYEGGHTERPTYDEVCSDTTGHAESVRVTFDPRLVTYDRLLDAFWALHDPTTINRQGPDVGSQYRSAIFFHSPEQRESAIASRQRAQAQFKRPIVTEIVPAGTFTPAEAYHQNYFAKRGQRTH